MNIDLLKEIHFKTARSGGKGGQNVNKVETMVEGRWLVDASQLVTEHQKEIIKTQLANRITAGGFLLVKSQTKRTQLENKEEVIKRINAIVNKALLPKKMRIAVKISKAAKARRLDSKKLNSSLKQNRQKLKKGDY